MKEQPKFNYPISVSQAAAETGIDYRTIKKAARGLKSIPGPKASILYDGHELFPAIYLGKDGRGTASEALRKLSLARTAQIELDMQIKRKERIPLAVVSAVDNEVFTAIAGIIKASGLPEKSVNEIFDQIRKVGEWQARMAAEIAPD